MNPDFDHKEFRKYLAYVGGTAVAFAAGGHSLADYISNAGDLSGLAAYPLDIISTVGGFVAGIPVGGKMYDLGIKNTIRETLNLFYITASSFIGGKLGLELGGLISNNADGTEAAKGSLRGLLAFFGGIVGFGAGVKIKRSMELRRMLKEFEEKGIVIHKNRQFDLNGIETPYNDINRQIRSLIPYLTDHLIVEDKFSNNDERRAWKNDTLKKYGRAYEPYLDDKLSFDWFKCIFTGVHILNDFLDKNYNINFEDIDFKLDHESYNDLHSKEKIDLVHHMENSLEAYLHRFRDHAWKTEKEEPQKSNIVKGELVKN